jgi:hypothetical protein
MILGSINCGIDPKQSKQNKPLDFLVEHLYPKDPCMLYMVTFTINIPPMLAYIPYMDPMG